MPLTIASGSRRSAAIKRVPVRCIQDPAGCGRSHRAAACGTLVDRGPAEAVLDRVAVVLDRAGARVRTADLDRHARSRSLAAAPAGLPGADLERLVRPRTGHRLAGAPVSAGAGDRARGARAR